VIRILWARVCPAAAANWAAGDATDGQLLLARIDGPPAAFVMEMHGHAAAWRRLLEIPEPWACSSIVFRTSRPGLERLGAVAGLEEPDGRRRYILEGDALEAMRTRRNRLCIDTADPTKTPK
jgi:hypothetical protein